MEYIFVKCMLFLLRLLPRKGVFLICRGFAYALFYLDSRRRLTTLKNLALAYPEKSENERLILAKSCYKNVGMSVAEIILILQQRIDIDTMIEDYQQVLHDLQCFLQHDFNGTLLLTAHFGNWELLGQFLAKHGHPVLVVGRKGNNPLIENKITKPFRQLFGNDLVHKSQAMNAIIRTLKKNGIAGMLIDQKSSGINSVKATFFGHPVDTINSTALLKMRYNPAVVPLFMARQTNGKFKLIIGKNAELPLLDTLSDEDKIAHLTQHYNDIIEDVIRQYPEQWFWMHNRWRLHK